MNLTDKLNNFRIQLPYLGKAFGLIWKTTPGWTSLWMLLLLVQGLLPVALVYLTKAIVDGLVDVVGSGGGWLSFKPLLVLVAFFVAIQVTIAVMKSVLGVLRTVQSQLVQDRISTIIQEKSVVLDLVFYESAEYFDKLHRARSDAAYRPIELVESLGTMVQNGITLAAMALVLVPYSVWAPVALVISTLPALFVVLDHRLRQYQWRIKNTENERRALYYDWLLTSRENAAEIRIFEIGNYFRSAFYHLREMLRNERVKLQKAQAAAELGSAFFALLVTGVVMGLMVWRAIAGAATMGDLALFYQAFNQGQRLMRSLLENVGQIYSNSLFLADFFEFLELEPLIRDPEEPEAPPPVLAKGISFHDVSFQYPSCAEFVLRNFHLDIEAGRVTAIVGANGAGKSTLVKLLCRLYDPQSGAVIFDDVNIRQYNVHDVRRMVTVLFQDSVRFNTTVAENIKLGDISRPEKEEDVVSAALASGADKLIAGLPEGYFTQLGRWFKASRDLSGGEWQRLALARAFFRQAPIIILDEPTSSMDSWSEMDWLKRFRQLAEGRTAVIIAHRFTTAMQADIIIVMDRGMIIESGAHDELIQLDGRYAASWREQMRENV